MADLTFAHDPDEPGYVYIRGNPVPSPIRTQIKHLGGIWHKHLQAWRIRQLMGRKLWDDAQEQGYNVEWAETIKADPVPRMLECPACTKPRRSTEPPGTFCEWCGSPASPVPPPTAGTLEAPPQAAPPVACTCGRMATPGRRHCPIDTGHRYGRSSRYCQSCGTELCPGPGKGTAEPAPGQAPAPEGPEDGLLAAEVT